MPSIAVAIMAKQPIPGTVKTRLRPLLSDGDIAALYECFLRDKVIQVRSLEAAAAVAYAPAASRAFFAELAPDFILVPQIGEGLSDRLTHTFQHLLDRGHDAVVATDSDSPTLPTAYLRRALDCLSRPGTDVVLGPCDDGGYYLIGLRRSYPRLFDAIPWSTSRVYDETLRRAAELGARVTALPRWYDVDTPTEFGRLRAEIADLGVAAPQHTRRFFGEWESRKCGPDRLQP